jgi:hypothetical protein
MQVLVILFSLLWSEVDFPSFFDIPILATEDYRPITLQNVLHLDVHASSLDSGYASLAGASYNDVMFLNASY